MSTIRVLEIGLPAESRHVPAEVGSAKVKAGLEKSASLFKERTDIHYEHCDCEPEDLSPAITALKKEKWDAVVVGNGVRSNLPLTYFFEQLIDAIRKEAPQCHIVFNTSPINSIEAVDRWCKAK